MSVIATIGFRPSEMDDYDQNFRRWNGKWGWGNSGTQEMKVDMSNGSIILPVNGKYRVTGMLVGQASEAGLVRAYANKPDAQDPSYPFPFYFGSAQTVGAGTVALPFSAAIDAGPNSPFCFFVSKTLIVNDPYAKVLIELIESK
jgi:hypothetical protein